MSILVNTHHGIVFDLPGSINSLTPTPDGYIAGGGIRPLRYKARPRLCRQRQTAVPHVRSAPRMELSAESWRLYRFFLPIHRDWLQNSSIPALLPSLSHSPRNSTTPKRHIACYNLDFKQVQHIPVSLTNPTFIPRTFSQSGCLIRYLLNIYALSPNSQHFFCKNCRLPEHGCLL